MPKQSEPKAELAAALRLASHFGFNEGVCNHFSLQVSEDHFLLNPHGVHWSRMKRSDIQAVTAATVNPSIEASALNIHGAIHTRHPHAACVMHTHMPFATTLTCLDNNRLRFIHQNSLRFYDDVSYDDDYGGLADNAEEGNRIAAEMGSRRVHFMANHGVIVTGNNVAEAFDRLYYLERACELQVRALSTGQPMREIDNNLARKTRDDFDNSSDYSQTHFNALLELLDTDYLE